MSDSQQSAKDRLVQVLPLIFAAFQDAKEHGLPTLVIAARDADGSGKMYMTLNDPEDFLRDVAEVTGMSFDLTDKQIVEYRAASLMAKWSS